jgi:hypothetical protein
MNTNTNRSSMSSSLPLSMSSASINAPEAPFVSSPETTPDSAAGTQLPSEPARLKPVRFACGLLLTTTGMGLVLLVGIEMLEVQQLAGNFALALVAFGVLTGVTLLGGGFGLMATASSGFDETEFDRLMKAGNIASATVQMSCDNDTKSAA